MPEQTAALYGLMAEFETAEELLAATQRAYAAGYRCMDAYAPFPVTGLADALGRGGRTKLPSIVLGGGLLGGVIGFGMSYYVSVVANAYNSGGRPLNSWPAFIPIVFELAILGAALAAALGLLFLTGLPEPHHPVFNVPRFAELASLERFFLCVEARDPKFSEDATRRLLESAEPADIAEVPY